MPSNSRRRYGIRESIRFRRLGLVLRHCAPAPLTTVLRYYLLNAADLPDQLRLLHFVQPSIVGCPFCELVQVINDNAANYTAWICRWRCLRAGHGSKVLTATVDESQNITWGGCRAFLRHHIRVVAVCPNLSGTYIRLSATSLMVCIFLVCSSMQESELAFLHGCTLAGGAKNYQLWNHRRRVALGLGTLNVAEVLPLSTT